jgi:osmotically-inducible protein OsmY
VVNDIGLNLTSKQTDPEIARDVVQKLENHILIPSDKIKVTVRDGWVMLEGEVRWQFQTKLAESAVRGTDGGAGISNTITIKTNVPPTRVKDQIETALRRSAELEACRITVEVEEKELFCAPPSAHGARRRSQSEQLVGPPVSPW